MHASAADVRRIDLGATLDHVHERHRMPAAEGVVGLQPVDDDTGLGGCIVIAALVGEDDELARR